MIVHSVREHDRIGLGGQISVTADVEYPDEPRSTVTFVGSTEGGPVVMRTASVEMFVSDPGRFGKFGAQWVRRFLDAAVA